MGQLLIGHLAGLSVRTASGLREVWGSAAGAAAAGAEEGAAAAVVAYRTGNALAGVEPSVVRAIDESMADGGLGWCRARPGCSCRLERAVHSSAQLPSRAQKVPDPADRLINLELTSASQPLTLTNTSPPIPLLSTLSAMSIRDSATRASYHPKGYGVSQGLARARRPFRTRNAITGSLIALFAFSVYSYSISAVKQDDFSDLPAPDRAAASSVRTIEDDKREQARQKEELKAGFQGRGPEAVTSNEVGLVAANKANWFEIVKGAWGGRDAAGQLVVGAPPVDKIGTISPEPIILPGKRLV